MRMHTTRSMDGALGLAGPQDPIDVTIVLPAYNEADCIEDSYNEIKGVMDPTGLDYEYMFVDDGSTDATWKIIRDLSKRDARVRGLRHRGNCGKACALANGFAYARGNIVAQCDADLQDDAHDILRAIDRVLEGHDAVTAHRVVRRDPISKRFPSKIYNWVLRTATGVKLHDMNSGLKAYRRDAALELVKYGYGELHRFFMVILAKNGFTVDEIPVETRPRTNGSSKYGAERYLRGAMDFLTVFFLSGYMERPLHFFGGTGVALLLTGNLVLAAVLIGGLAGWLAIGTTPLLVLSGLFIMTGVQLLVVGLIAEMIGNLEHGSRSRLKISEVSGVDRRTGIGQPSGVLVERRHPSGSGVLTDYDGDTRDTDALREQVRGGGDGRGQRQGAVAPQREQV